MLPIKEMVSGLERCELPPGSFTHAAHVQVAWSYLQESGIERGSERFVESVARYVAHVGAEDKYHETLTRALLRIVAARMHGEPWERFAENNRDLFDDAATLLARHYSKELLDSPAARQRIIAPDLQPLP